MADDVASAAQRARNQNPPTRRMRFCVKSIVVDVAVQAFTIASG
ncbi:hypothetical protein [Planobispora takensis]|nr:hypothetical protein [Planobispora takensis]